MRKRVLIVEDHPDNALIYDAMLRHAGYDVLIAADGLAGLDAIRTHLPDIVLLDIALPKLSGFDVAAAVLHEPKLRHIPLVALTALAFSEDQRRAESLGFVAYLSKPAEPRAVLDEVMKQIGDPLDLRAS